MIFVLKVPNLTSIISDISWAIVKMSVPIIKRRSWGFQNTPNLQSLHKIWLKNSQNKVAHCRSKSNIKSILENNNFLSIAITWLKIIQIFQVGGVLESSRTPLNDRHRDFADWCIHGWVIHKKNKYEVCTSECELQMTFSFILLLSLHPKRREDPIKNRVNVKRKTFISVYRVMMRHGRDGAASSHTLCPEMGHAPSLEQSICGGG